MLSWELWTLHDVWQLILEGEPYTVCLFLQKAVEQKSEHDVSMMWSFTVFKIAVTMWNKTNNLQASNLHGNSC